MKKFDKIPFEQIIAALLDNDKPFPPIYLHRFSDLEPKQAKALREAWPRVDAERRFNLIHDLDELASADTVVIFTETAEIALDDADAKIRAAAIDLLSSLEDATHTKQLVQLLTKDPSELVREHAAIALGFYMYLHEMEEINPEVGAQIEKALFDTFKSKEDANVRRRCMESLGYSSRKDMLIILEGAFHSSESQWIASALFAMGRSGLERWNSHILEALEGDDPEIVLEAARAAGELGITEAVPMLTKMVEDENKPGEAVYYAAIWALSAIGGQEVRETLEKVGEKAAEEDDEELISFLEDALENLDFAEKLENGLDMLDLDLEEMVRSGRMIDLEAPLADLEEEDEETPTDLPADNGHQPAKKKGKKH
ncbi:MAG TPA: HEAT repeat domain-containing protein [Anaerolineaceae bacterium]|nr:HEAT repeat domain-containing protein [Anaerolineaceae bacterium]